MASGVRANQFSSFVKPRPRRAPSTPLPAMQVVLTQQEEDICNLLDDFCKTKNETNTSSEPLVCRIAGGWVRDKLLGLESHDIDFAINRMTGEALAYDLKEAGKIDSVGVTIASNPEQSKHLATTRTKIFGTEVDLVNLRSETYSNESRIPTMEYGTALQDAQRRDLTINALFYNIHSRTVEDFTEKGIDDLKAGRIRTPLDPKITFEDDPLRILRSVRFASRLGFELDESISVTAREESIHATLATKISRERIGEELDKTIRGPDPVYAIELLHSFNLLRSIFVVLPQISSVMEGSIGSTEQSLAGVTILHQLLSHAVNDSEPALPAVHASLLRLASEDASTKARLTLAAALSPFRGITYKVKNKNVTVVEHVIREALRLGSQYHYLDGIPPLFAAASLIKRSFPTNLESVERSELGLMFRQPVVQNLKTGSEWSSSILFSLVQELIEFWGDGKLEDRKAAECIHRYNKLAEKIAEFKLEEAILAPPILNGRDISQTLGVKQGPSIGVIIEKVVIWQLKNPELGAKECSDWLREEAESGSLKELVHGMSKVVGSDVQIRRSTRNKQTKTDV